ncbi:MAG: c-type cytochrome [Gallionella sp.]
MKPGEKAILALIGAVLVVGVARSLLHVEGKHDREIPFYTTATRDLAVKGMEIYNKNGCKECHSLWTMKDILETVPAPILDGIGSLRTEAWLYDYLSSSNPQATLPSRLKKEYQMPSYRSMPETDRQLLAQYLSSLKVKDWYLEETKKAEYEKLTGMVYPK